MIPFFDCHWLIELNTTSSHPFFEWMPAYVLINLSNVQVWRGVFLFVDKRILLIAEAPTAISPSPPPPPASLDQSVLKHSRRVCSADVVPLWK